MNVKELRELLSAQPDDCEVVLSSDPEGNSFAPLADIGDERFEDGEPVDDEEDGPSNAVVFWPGYWKRK